MIQRSKIIAVFAIIMLCVLSANVMAQTETPSPESNVSAATQGQFGTEVDDFIGLTSWMGVLGDAKWFGYTGYGLNGFQLGFARNVGSVYLGIFYGGQIVNWTTGGTKESVEVTYDSTPASSLFGQATEKKTTTAYKEDELLTDNDVDVLIGFGGIGQGLSVRLGFYESLTTQKNPRDDIRPGNIDETVTETYGTSTTQYQNKLESYSFQKGYLIPNINVGIKLGLGNLTVKPYLKAAIGINQDNQEGIFKSYTQIAGTTSGTATTNLSGYKNNYVNPFFTLGADVDFSEHVGAGISYQIGFDIYKNDYDVFGISGTAKGTVGYGDNSSGIGSGSRSERVDTLTSWQQIDVADLTLTEQSAVKNKINPSIWYSNSLGDLQFSAQFEIPVQINTSGVETWNETTTITKSGPQVTDKDNERIITAVNKAPVSTVETTKFILEPAILLGGTYPLIKDRLSINAGIGITLPQYTGTTTVTKPGEFTTATTETRDGNGNVITPKTTTVTPAAKTDSVETLKEWAGLDATVSTGFTFNFNSNVAVDVLVSSYTTGYTFYIHQWNVLFTIKK
ncbi:hypothetical protein AGMMS50293_06890 [Spirochaetia bacterium]|nr:hypothetical protein AGMMS50293_06890 [Spirochaetia bacterium]